MGRGKLTEAIKEKSVELLGYEISQRELRLMPYVDYQMKNNRLIDNVNDEEVKIIGQWLKNGWLRQTAQGFEITRDFYNAINEILWLGYVSYDYQ